MGYSGSIDRWGLSKGLITASEFCEWVGFEPDPWQLSVIEARESQLVCCSRQAGKSETCAHAAVFDALGNSRTNALIIAPAKRQSQELLRKAKDIVAKLPWHEKLVVDTTTEIEFANGSRVIALPTADPKKIRSYHAKKVIVEEAAMVSDDAIMTVRPMLATKNGTMTMISSPMGKRGMFYELFADADEDMKRTVVTCWDIPRIPSKFLEKEKKLLGPDWFAQEYECKFLEVSMNVFGVPRFVESGLEVSLL